MDYDAYDALLHHIFRQVRHPLLPPPHPRTHTGNTHPLSHRLKVTPGSSRPRRTSTPESVCASTRATSVSSRTRTATSSPSRPPSAPSTPSSPSRSAARRSTPPSPPCKSSAHLNLADRPGFVRRLSSAHSAALRAWAHVRPRIPGTVLARRAGARRMSQASLSVHVTVFSGCLQTCVTSRVTFLPSVPPAFPPPLLWVSRRVLIVHCRKEDADAIFVDTDTRIQILDTMSWLPRADKEQCGAFIVSAFCTRPVPADLHV